MKTYKEQFDKLTEAYIKDEIRPYKNCSCFIGTLLGGGEWGDFRLMTYGGEGIILSGADSVTKAINFIKKSSDNTYTPREIFDLEKIFLQTYSREFALEEESLFKAFEVTLDLLKRIHISKGEDVDSQMIPEFKKRVCV